MASMLKDGSLLMHLLRQLGSAGRLHASRPSSPKTAWEASALPAPMLRLHLHGAPESASAGLPEPGAAALEEGMEQGMRLLWWAAACFAQHASVTDWQMRLQWLAHSINQVMHFAEAFPSSLHI
jgi:hypothetical protein